MIVRHAVLAKQCSRAALSSTMGRGVAASVDEQLAPSLSSNSNRPFSSLPHHLARKNNGMVNVFVKSTKVPRPVAMVPERHPSRHKLRNQLKKIVALKTPNANEEEHLPSRFSYAGNASLPITSELKIVMPEDDVPSGIWPAFRMMVSSCASAVHVVTSRNLMHHAPNYCRMKAATFVNRTPPAPPTQPRSFHLTTISPS